MFKALWDKMITKFHAGEAKLDAETIAVLAHLAIRIEALETYLANTPNHIGQVYQYTPILTETMPVLAHAPAPVDLAAFIAEPVTYTDTYTE